jgi:hypothetical protein
MMHVHHTSSSSSRQPLASATTDPSAVADGIESSRDWSCAECLVVRITK